MRIVNPTAVTGEDQAVLYLEKQNYQIIERNFRRGYGEIDIIALDRSVNPKTLCFIEVKTRKSNFYGTPLEAITISKLKTMTKTAKLYKLLHPFLPESMRLDAISIVLSAENQLLNLEHLQNIGYE